MTPLLINSVVCRGVGSVLCAVAVQGINYNRPTEKEMFILGLQGIPQGFRSEASLIGGIYNDKGTPYGTWYLGGAGDSNMLRFQFTDPVPTDRDIGDIRVSSISYLTSDPWPERLP